jgi:REP element-mobilizing transposase RayT
MCTCCCRYHRSTSVTGGGVYQREECHNDSAKIYGTGEEPVGQDFWARGYYVSTVGRDEAEVRRYIQAQEKEDRRLDQLKIFE